VLTIPCQTDPVTCRLSGHVKSKFQCDLLPVVGRLSTLMLPVASYYYYYYTATTTFV